MSDFNIERGVLKEYCGDDVKVIVPSNVTELGDRAFAFNEDAMEIVLPEGLKKIGELVFAECMELVKINIPDGVTEIGEQAFYNLPVLGKLILPRALKKIGRGAFGGYSAIDLVYKGTVAEWNKIEKIGIIIGDPNGVYVTCSDGKVKVEAY